MSPASAGIGRARRFGGAPVFHAPRIRIFGATIVYCAPRLYENGNQIADALAL
ncbi:hypothetical protein OH687_02660 [Burkholderia anthina]|nr:hypothetical protein OH687_02660 [Burkholderia anthina]